MIHLVKTATFIALDAFTADRLRTPGTQSVLVLDDGHLARA